MILLFSLSFVLILGNVRGSCDIRETWEFQGHKYQKISELGRASAEDDVLGVEAAIESGCDVNYNGSQFYYRHWNFQGGFTALHIASTHGANGAVKKLLTYKKSKDFINIKDDFGATPLYAAAYWRFSSTVKILNKAGAKSDIPNNNGATPLYVAAQNGHLHVVKTLVSLGADMEKGMDQYGETPLFVAAEKGHLDIVRHLVERGANIDVIAGSGKYTPLITAVVNGSPEVVDYLLKQCANTTIKDGTHGKTPLEWGYLQNNLEKISLMSKATEGTRKQCKKQVIIDKQVVFCPVTQSWRFQNQTYKKITSLGKAAAENDFERIKGLVKNGCKILYNKTKFLYRYQGLKGGFTALHVASTHGANEVISKLLTYENYFTSFINNQDEFGATATYAAAYWRYSSTVQVLHEAGADLDIPNQNGATPLYVAAQNGHFHTVKTLVELGADINKALHTKNQSPLMIAVYKDHKDIVEFLLENCAKAEIRHNRETYKRKFNLTALEWAEQNEREEMVKILKEGLEERKTNCIEYQILSQQQLSQELSSVSEVSTGVVSRGHTAAAVTITLVLVMLVAGVAYSMHRYLQLRDKNEIDRIQLVEE